MSKSKLRNLIALTIATFCLSAISFSIRAENKVGQPDKDRLVLMPLQTGVNDNNMQARMEAALIQGLAQKYEVLSGNKVIQSLKKAAGKNKHAAGKKGCDEAACLKNVAADLHADIFATVQVTKTEGDYLLVLNIKNFATSQAVFDNSLPCKGCDQTQLADKFKELSVAPVAEPARALEPGDVFKDCATCPEMVVIPAGSFDMGSAVSDEKDEKPEHRVTIDQPFAIGKVDITRGQYAAFVRATGHDNDHDADDKCWTLVGDKWEELGSNNWRNPGYQQDDSHPVACVDWIDAQAYVKWLSLKTGKHYQLPTESEWEYACRAGGQGEYCGSASVDNLAWYDQNSDKTTHPAASKQANAFGLYDMSGNVEEWMEDSYHDRYIDAPNDGSAWAGDRSKRVLRGGSWLYSQRAARSAFRTVSAPEYRYSDTGFRVVRTLP